jgi:hypothetical protein
VKRNTTDLLEYLSEGLDIVQEHAVHCLGHTTEDLNECDCHICIWIAGVADTLSDWEKDEMRGG